MKPKIEFNNLNDLQKELEHGNNLVDYFLVIGIDKEYIFSDFLYNNDITKLNEIIKPSILSKFPNFDKENISIDNSIIDYCFPNGYQISESNSFIKQESFSIVVDNSDNTANFTNFAYKYISCLVFYENIESYYNIYKKLKEGLSEPIEVDGNSESIYNIIYINLY